MSINLEKIPPLGFGLMRLPQKDGQIDMDENSPTDTFIRYYERTVRKNYDRLFTETARRLAEEQKAIDRAYVSALCDLVNGHHKKLSEITSHFDKK